MKNRKAMKAIIGVLLLAVMAAGAFFWMNRPEEPPITEAVQRENLESLVEEIGEIHTENRRLVVANRAGEIGLLAVTTGDEVETGTVLAEIDSSDWRLKINQLTDEISAMRSEYQQLLNESAREEERAASGLELSLKQLEEARDQKERVERLYEAGAATRQELTSAEMEETRLLNAVHQAELAVEAAKDAVSSSIQEAYLARIRQMEREKSHTESQREAYYIQAPVSGTILYKMVEEGAYVQPGQELYELGDVNSLYVTADLLAREMRGIEVGIPVRIIHRDLEAEAVKGHIRKIDPVAVATVSELGVEQRRVKVEIALENHVNEWKPGYEVDVEIIREVRENTLTIPERSIFWKDARPHVLVWEENEAVEREIETGLNSRGRMEIVSGLQEGEKVVLDPS
ncbi:MAG: efflux RND transporter periplasmic adaptor subunit [Tindallia sp. MSAO_Bac2]|nr:MAG: efflux RND transporter periplasmic adaptor subunit [Tindallia sp. MSAO_Bac2]